MSPAMNWMGKARKVVRRWSRRKIGIKAGDVVELTCSFSTDAGSFKKGERMLVAEVGFFGLVLEDESDKRRWVTDVSKRDVRRIS